MLAALDPRLELVAVTTVGGNTSIDHTTENTLRVLDHIGARGARLPRRRRRAPALAGRRDEDKKRSGKIHGDSLALPARSLAGAATSERRASSSTPSTRAPTSCSSRPGR